MKNNPAGRPVTSQSVATQVAPKPAEEVAQPSTATQSAVNNGAAVTQMPKTGFNAEIAKVAQNVVDNMNRQGVTPAATPAPVNTPAEQQPQQPKQMSFVDLLNAFYTPETAEERAKRERKEKWDKTAAAIGDGISALANLYYTTKGAPNSYDGKNSMSERTRQLYDKLDKDRKENERWYLNHYMNAAKMDEEAKRYADERDYKRGRDAVADERYEDQRQYSRGRDAANDQFRQEGREHDWKRQAERDAVQDDNTQWQHQYQETQAARQQANANRSYQLQKDAYNRQLEKDNPTVGFALGNGRKANIKKQDINTQNVSYVYNKLPKEIRDQYAQEPSYDKDGKPVETNKKDANGKYVKDANGNYIKEPVMKARKLNDSDKMAIIGEHIANYPEVQNAWKEIGGEITTSTQQTGGGKTHSHRVGGNNSTTDV